MPRRILSLPGLLLITVALAAAAGVATTASVDVADALGQAPSPALAAPVFRPCADVPDPEVECATFTVPIDHGDPQGGAIDLPLVRLPATDPDARLGVLLAHPGGPGGSPRGFVLGEAGQPRFISDALRARFDIIGLEHRGLLGTSLPVRCAVDDPAAGDATPPAETDVATVPAARGATEQDELMLHEVPWLWNNLVGDRPLPTATRAALQATGLDDAERTAAVEAQRQLAAACGANSAAILPHMSTVNVARDMEALRLALGEEQISFMGASYGTVVGATFAELFPDSLRALMLDSSADLRQWHGDPVQFRREQVVGREQVLDEYLNSCLTVGVQACPFGEGDPRGALDRLLVGLDADPIAVDPPGPTPQVTIDDEEVRGFLAAGTLTNADQWPIITAFLTVLEARDIDALSQLLSGGEGGDTPPATPEEVEEALEEEAAAADNFSGVFLSVTCTDADHSPDPAAPVREDRQLAALAPRLGVGIAIASAPCGAWPARALERLDGQDDIVSATPTLLMHALLDTQTPRQWGVALADQVSPSSLVFLDGVAHGVAQSGNGPCAPAVADRYLIDLELPTTGSVCEQDPAASAALPPELRAAPPAG